MKNFTLVTAQKELFNVREVSGMLGMGVSTIWRRVQERTFPQPLKTGPGSTRWRRGDLEAWVSDPAGWVEKQEGVQ